MTKKQSILRLGTCTWNYDSWVGLVYSKTQRTAAAYLPEYAQHFNTVEIDSWFYHMPERKEVLQYRDAVPEGFTFTCKVPQDICLTHLRTHSKDDKLIPNPHFFSPEMFKVFIERIKPLLYKMDAIEFEFEYLNKLKMPSLGKFLDTLNRFFNQIPNGLPLALEPRNSNYMRPEYFKFIQDLGVTHIFSEKQYMPHIYELYKQFKSFLGKTSVIRLMGGDRKQIEEKTGDKWDKIVEPKSDLPKIAEMVNDMLSKMERVTVSINNHYEGSATLTIEKINKLLSKTELSGGINELSMLRQRNESH